MQHFGLTPISLSPPDTTNRSHAKKPAEAGFLHIANLLARVLDIRLFHGVRFRVTHEIGQNTTFGAKNTTFELNFKKNTTLFTIGLQLLSIKQLSLSIRLKLSAKF